MTAPNEETSKNLTLTNKTHKQTHNLQHIHKIQIT